MQRERMVGSSAAGLSVSRNRVANSRRLFQNFQQRVGRFLHELGVAEDVNPLAAFHRLVVDLVNDVADLVHLHQHLRRVGRDDQHVGMGLHEQASVALVGLAQVLARFHRLGKALFQRVGLGDADAVACNGHRNPAARR